MKKENQEPEKDFCAGYQRQPHPALPAIYFQYPDGTQKGLCRKCADKWLDSDEEFPSKTSNF